ncbi:hypothetical protein Tco_0331579 [Tanacetum coccineum]
MDFGREWHVACLMSADGMLKRRHPAFSSLYQLIQSFSSDAPGLFRLRANCASSSVKMGLEGVIGDAAVKKNKGNRAGCGRGASANVVRVLLWSLVTNQMI